MHFLEVSNDSDDRIDLSNLDQMVSNPLPTLGNESSAQGMSRGGESFSYVINYIMFCFLNSIYFGVLMFPSVV